jgi:hypothetical protein
VTGRARRRWILGGLFLLALALRAVPLGYGLPHTYRYDEGRYVSAAAHMAKEISRPRDYRYGPLYPAVVAVGYGGLFVGGKITGDWSRARAFETAYYRDRTPFFLLARGISALAGALAVLVLLAAARRWLAFGREDEDEGPVPPPGAVLAAAGLAFLPVAVAYGAQAQAESLVVLLVALWLLLAGRFARSGRGRHVFLAGVALGLAGATKYNALIYLPWQLVLPLLFLGRKEGARGRLWAAAVVGPVLGLVIGAPWALGEPGALWAGLHFNATVSSQSGPVLPGVARNLVALLLAPASSGLGPVLGILAAVGTVLAVRRAGRTGGWLAGAGWGFVLATAIANREAPVPRYLLPAYPPLLILAGAALQAFLDEAVRRLARVPRLLVWATVAALVVPATVSSVAADAKLLREDTRTAAADWIQGHVPAESAVLLEDTVASPPLRPDEAAAARDPRGGRRAEFLANSGGPTYDLYWLPVPWGMVSENEARVLARDGVAVPGFGRDEAEKLTLAYWRGRGVDLVVVSSFVYQPYFRENADAPPAYREFYAALFEQGRLLHREDPARGNRPGPLILVYDIAEGAGKP